MTRKSSARYHSHRSLGARTRLKGYRQGRLKGFRFHLFHYGRGYSETATEDVHRKASRTALSLRMHTPAHYRREDRERERCTPSSLTQQRWPDCKAMNGIRSSRGETIFSRGRDPAKFCCRKKCADRALSHSEAQVPGTINRGPRSLAKSNRGALL